MKAEPRWDTDPDLIADWRYEVANGDTLLGLEEWLCHRSEREANVGWSWRS